MTIDFSTDDVAVVFAAWPNALRTKILRLRALIFDVATQTSNIGMLQETLKWNVPAYLTVKPKSGTTIRLEGNAETGNYGMYVPCSTTLIEHCKETYPGVFSYTKNRGVVFGMKDDVPEAELRHFIAMALTYHLKSGPTKLTQSIS